MFKLKVGNSYIANYYFILLYHSNKHLNVLAAPEVSLLFILQYVFVRAVKDKELINHDENCLVNTSTMNYITIICFRSTVLQESIDDVGMS